MEPLVPTCPNFPFFSALSHSPRSLQASGIGSDMKSSLGMDGKVRTAQCGVHVCTVLKHVCSLLYPPHTSLTSPFCPPPCTPLQDKDTTKNNSAAIAKDRADREEAQNRLSAKQGKRNAKRDADRDAMRAKCVAFLWTHTRPHTSPPAAFSLSVPPAVDTCLKRPFLLLFPTHVPSRWQINAPTPDPTHTHVVNQDTAQTPMLTPPPSLSSSSSTHLYFERSRYAGGDSGQRPTFHHGNDTEKQGCCTIL
jgi:hypothetical protein